MEDGSWNRLLTDAARWFSWDSVERRPEPFCDHQDTQGHWPDWRARAFGYPGYAGAENAFCGYLAPEQAIEGWMNSPGHRSNLLDPNSREIGLGYYLREEDGRGYIFSRTGTVAVHCHTTATCPCCSLGNENPESAEKRG